MTQMLTVLAILLAAPFGGFAQSDTRPPTEARLLSKPAAEYPDEALAGDITGEVVIAVEVDRKGKVKRAQPLGGPPSLQKAAAKAARKARFEPATVAGQPVNGRASIVYKFDLTSPTCPPGNDVVYAPWEVTSKALILQKPEPGFTAKARANFTTGKVVLRAVLCRTGEVTDIEVLEGLPDGLTGRAIIAARRIRFRPGTKDGRAVSQRVTLAYNFNIY